VARARRLPWHLLRSHKINTLPTTGAEFVRLGSMLFDDDEEAVTDRARLDVPGS
jgi:hypothetical protein